MSVDMCLELREAGLPGQYSVRVLSAPAGGRTQGSLDLDVEGIQEQLRDVESTVLASSVPTRRVLPRSEQILRGMGSDLFAAAFPRDVYGTYRASLAAAADSGERLRVVLSFAAPQLAALPWELMYDSGIGAYVCRSEPLLRTIPAEDYHPKPLRITPPLRILGIVASPRGLPQLDVEAEKEHLSAALAEHVDAAQIELVWTEEATWDEIHDLLLAGPWHVVHFIGHGDYDASSESGVVIFNGPGGRPHRITADQLVDLLSAAAPTPRLVFLNSCNSGRSGDEDLFSSTSAALVRGGISAVVAMQFSVSDDGAIAFSRGFYKALAAGRAVDEATRNGRIAIRGRSDTSLEWVTPVLCVRGGATELFTFAKRPRRTSRPATAPDLPLIPRAPAPSPTEPEQEADTTPRQDEQPERQHAPEPEPATEAPPAEAPSPPAKPAPAPALFLAAPSRAARTGDDADGLAISADGSLAAVGRREGVTVLDTASGAVVRELRTEDGRDFSRVALNPGGRLVAAGSWFGSLCVWDVRSGVQAMSASTGSSVDALAFSSDSRLVVASRECLSEDARTTLVSTWNVEMAERGRTARRTRRSDATDAVALSVDGAWIAEADHHGGIRVFDEAGGTVALVQAPGQVRVLAVSREANRVAAGSEDVGLCVWSLAGRVPLLDVVRSGPVRHLVFNAGGTQLATGCLDGRLLVLDPDSGRVHVDATCHQRPFALALAGDCSRLVTLQDDGAFAVWDLTAAQPGRRGNLQEALP
ncbi:CHAT domain-containing protein [Sinomonas flava]|uniref:CHAT domain-containing protein n=1 Tax=Sinomonas flava TaxID=496857 RepID=A0ABP5NJM6_9MICC